MEINITTLMLALNFVLFTQVIAIYIQYKINREYKGIGYWLIATVFMSISFILMPMITVKGLHKIAIIANPFLILGHIFLYIGAKRFHDKKVKKWIPISIFLTFNLFYYYYMYINNSITVRTIVVSLFIAGISFMISYELFFKRDRFTSNTTNFTPIVLLIYGLLHIMRGILIFVLNPVNSYSGQGYSIIFATMVSIVIGNLWTFGLIITVNQRLNIENRIEKEKLEFIFNTNLDAQLITRLKDGLIVNVNDEFTKLSGYSKEEVIGNTTKEINCWYYKEDRESFKEELNNNKIYRNMEFVFKRKDGSGFTGIISAKIININLEKHIIILIRDITEEKLMELKMEKLVEQLEIEKKTAELNAITDSLTGLFNRGYFDNMLRTEFFRLMRSKSILSLIMLDIDHFKNYNDSYGHLAGDKCIQMIANVLKTTLERASDIVARYGGEEFIVILPDTDGNGAKIIGERMRKAIEDLSIPHKTSETAKYITVSVGIVSVCPAKLESPEQVLKLVDEALYSAKEKGRNCYVYNSNSK